MQTIHEGMHNGLIFCISEWLNITLLQFFELLIYITKFLYSYWSISGAHFYYCRSSSAGVSVFDAWRFLECYPRIADGAVACEWIRAGRATWNAARARDRTPCWRPQWLLWTISACVPRASLPTTAATLNRAISTRRRFAAISISVHAALLHYVLV